MEYTLKFRSFSEKLVCSCHLKFTAGGGHFGAQAVFLVEAGTVHLKSCHRKFSSETLFLARRKSKLSGYSYNGESIQFQEERVWPMRNNPSKNGIHHGTCAYFEAKAFHRVYRSLLGKLQETFGGEPEKISLIILGIQTS